jgi:hypothetical protein
MRIVMALKVRDEEDVIEANLRFHRALGVDHFMITDNGSTDGTLAVLEAYQEAGLARVFHREGDYRALAQGWMQDMARAAALGHDADWVIHNDADEFWLPARGTLADALGGVDERYGVVIAPRTEFIARPDGPGSFAERLVHRERRSSLQPKVAHRADPDVVMLDRGSHDVAWAPAGSDVSDVLRPPGRAVHRLVRDRDGDGEAGSAPPDIGLVWAPRWPIRILHFPVRSLEQFRRRTEVALSGGYAERGRVARLRERQESGGVEELFAELLTDDAELERALGEGRVVRDERLREILRRCPDPLAPGAPEAGTVAVNASPEEEERELAELELDAMRLLARSQRFLIVQRERTRERSESLREENERLTTRVRRARRRADRLGDRLQREQQRPWSRLRGLWRRGGRSST